MISRLRGAIALGVCLAVLAATPAVPNTAVPIKNGNGGTINEDFVALASGNLAPTHVLVDGTGTPYSPANPLLTAPAILAVAFTDRSGAVSTAGSTVVDIAASAARKGGSIRAATANVGLIAVTLKDASGNLHVEHLAPGETYSLTINGYVLQVEILVAGDTPGDTFSGVTFQ